MPIPADKLPSGYDTRTIKIDDIEIDGQDQFGNDTCVIKMSSGAHKYQAEGCSLYVNAKNWESKFYDNKDGYKTFSRFAVPVLLAKVVSGEVKNANDLIGKTFDGVIVAWDKGEFIDWTATAKVNDVFPFGDKATETKPQEINKGDNLPF